MNTLSDQDIRQKIADLDSVPLPTWAPASSWGKVESELQERPVWKGKVFLWSGAAVIVLFFSIGLWLLQTPPAAQYATIPFVTPEPTATDEAKTSTVVYLEEYLIVSTPKLQIEQTPESPTSKEHAAINSNTTTPKISNGLENTPPLPAFAEENQEKKQVSKVTPTPIEAENPENTAPKFVWLNNPIPFQEVAPHPTSSKNEVGHDSTIAIVEPTNTTPGSIPEQKREGPVFVWLSNPLPLIYQNEVEHASDKTPTALAAAEYPKRDFRSRRASPKRRWQILGSSKPAPGPSSASNETLAFRTKL